MANFYKWLKNGSSREAAVNGSVTAVEFEYDPQDLVDLERMILHIAAASTPAWAAENYANRAALTNGIKVEVINTDDDSVVTDLLDGFPIKSDHEWRALCFDYVIDTYGSGDDNATARWTFGKAGKPIRLQLNQKIMVTIQDDLTDLTHQWFQVQGTTV